MFGIGLDDAIYHRPFSNGRWYDIEGVGGNIRGSPSAVSTGSTRVDVFVLVQVTLLFIVAIGTQESILILRTSKCITIFNEKQLSF